MRAIVIINRLTVFNPDILKGVFHDHYRIGNRQSG